MKIALIGYGKMGKMVEQAALAQGHIIIAKIDPDCASKKISKKTLSNADICIDFTHPDCAINNLKLVADQGVSMIMGTTGWYEHIELAKEIVANSKIGFLYAPNFSIGMSLFLNVVAKAAALIAPFDVYDVNGFEIHHNQKIDAPSGTAKAICQKIEAVWPKKKQQIQFSSLRVGSVPGTHTVLFDSPVDTITLTHTVRSREGFACGAIQAAQWLQGKQGFFTLDDMLRSLYV